MTEHSFPHTYGFQTEKNKFLFEMKKAENKYNAHHLGHSDGFLFVSISITSDLSWHSIILKEYFYFLELCNE